MLFSGEVDGTVVRRPNEIIHAAVKAFGEVGTAAACAVINHQAPAVGFIFRRELRAIGDGLAVGRIDGMAIDSRDYP